MERHQYYYVTRQVKGGWAWKVYEFDVYGNREIVLGEGVGYSSEGEAADAAVAWADEHDIEVELA